MTDQAHPADRSPTQGATVNPPTTRTDEAPREQAGSLAPADQSVESNAPPAREIGGRQGPDPTRYGDWELKGRCIDF